jgi:threonine dehydrogenase-like Zn-dependent dehydrogenase
MTIQGFAVLREEKDDSDDREWKPNTIHLRDDIPTPSIDDVPGNKGVRIRILQVGLCGTDKEINGGLYGNAPTGRDHLVVGHESFGQVVEVALGVSKLAVGDLVVVTVRRPSSCELSSVRYQDMTTDNTYYERGISLLNGFLCESVVEHEEYIVRVCDAADVGTPAGKALEAIGVLTEPMSIAQKAFRNAWAMQEARLPKGHYHPETALVLGAGPIGQLSAMSLRLRGLEVTVAAGKPAARNSRAIAAESIGCRYVPTQRKPLAEVFDENDRYDIVFDATGHSHVAFDALRRASKNGVVIWQSITGGSETYEVPSDAINQEFVLGNKMLVGTVNAHLSDWASSIGDFEKANEAHEDWLASLISYIDGFDEDAVQSYVHWPTADEPTPAKPVPAALSNPIKGAVRLGSADEL